MKQEWAMKWADDLDANAHKQGKGYLRTPKGDRYCCLGRLCVIAGDPLENPADERYETELLPTEILSITGFKGNVEFENNDLPKIIGCPTFAAANDKGIGFKQIAKYIRKHWDKI